MSQRHPSVLVWQQYVENLLPNEEREPLEEHLYSCDMCLSLYMQVVENQEHRQPSKQMPQLTEQIMGQIALHQYKGVELLHKKRFYQRTIFHYAVASIVTLVLMWSGIFEQMGGIGSKLTQQANAADKHQWENNRMRTESSVAEQLMNKAVGLIDRLESGTEERRKK
ncbi:hypothetical protein [Paenibacillus sp. y28]|uniref:hypothetical protein n=1 Tax=Paenibacillus sp. y28 TaxID=3129110 RepID=UPI003016A64C